MSRRGAFALGAVALLLAAALPFVLGQGGRLAGLLVDSMSEPLFAPPTARLASPVDGDGVGNRVVVAGDARAAPGRFVTDVQVRVDGGRWASLPDAPRSVPVSAFHEEIDLAEGDHAIEARAWDGASYSLPARAFVRVGAPSVAIAIPPDGAGLVSGTLVVSGAARLATGVVLEVDGSPFEATLARGTWTTTVMLAPGLHVLRAIAEAPNATSLPAVATIAVGPQPPPTVSILSPREGDAWGPSGEPGCDACILLRGAVSPGARVQVALDGAPPQDATVAGSAWSLRVPVDSLLRGAHHAVVTPEGGVPRDVNFLVRAPREVAIEGDEAPRLTGTPLSFRVPSSASASWLLDGAPAGEGASVTVQLGSPGGHSLVARVRDAQQRVGIVDVPLLALNRAPSATFSAAPGPAVDEVPFNASAQDPDGRVVRYAWSFGDGAQDVTRGPATTHKYATTGVYRANLSVMDDQGAWSAPATRLVAVANAPPVADFRALPGSPSVLDAVSFTDLSLDPDGPIASRAWDFGDGTTSDSPAPLHTFSTRGPHEVVLRVADPQGAASLAKRVVTVRNLPPDPAFTVSPAVPRAGEEVVFTDATRKPDGALSSWAWAFGDGSANASGAIVLHAFPAPGRYQVTLRVTDDWGEVAMLQRFVDVTDASPLLRDVKLDPPAPQGAQPIRFVAWGASPLVNLSWDFGDVNGSDEAEPVHAYARAGLYHASVTARNAANDTASLAFDVVVTDALPFVSLPAPPTAYAGHPVVLQANVLDKDGAIARVRFDADGDGIPDCEGVSPQCVFVYPAPGVYAARVDVLDDEGGAGEAQAAVRVEAAPPEIAPPLVTVAQPLPGATLQGSVLVSGTASGLRPLVAIEAQVRNATRAFALGDAAWMRAQGTAAWALPLDTTALPDGAYRLVVRAVDDQGREGQQQVPIEIRNGPDEGFVLRVANAPEEPIGDAFDLEGSAYHPQGVTGVRWSLDGGPWRDPVGPAYAFTLPLRDLAPGKHLVVIDAFRGPSSKRELPLAIQVAKPAPILALDEPPGPFAYGLLHAAGRIDGEGSVLWKLDDGLWREANRTGGEWRLDEPTRGLAAGRHTLSLKAAGPDGVEGPRQDFVVRVIQAAGDVEPAPAQDAPRHEAPLGAWLALAALAFGLARRRL